MYQTSFLLYLHSKSNSIIKIQSIIKKYVEDACRMNTASNRRKLIALIVQFVLEHCSKHFSVKNTLYNIQCICQDLLQNYFFCILEQPLEHLFLNFFLQNKKCVRKCSNKVVYSSTLFCCYIELFSFLLLNSMKGQ